MGKYSVLLLIGLGVTALASTQRTLIHTHLADSEQFRAHGLDVLARDVALSAYHEALHVLEHEASADSIDQLTGTIGGGKYTVDFDVDQGPPYRVHIRSVGVLRSGSDPPARHVVEATYRHDRQAWADTTSRLGHLPPHFRYALLTGEPLRFAVFPRVETADPTVNANIHTNQTLNLAVSAQALLGWKAVQGFGSYSEGVLHVPLFAQPADAFAPVSNPDDDPTLLYRESVSIPEFDVRDWADRATRVEPTTLRLFGRERLGSRVQPEVVYVKGDLIVADTHFEGHGIYLIEGRLIFDSTVSGLLGSSPESRLAFFSNGSVLFNGVGDVEGHISTQGSVTFSAAPTFHGNITARGSINLVAAPTIRFVPPDPELVRIISETSTFDRMERIAYQEWEG